jgi:hypothetical protein
MLMRFSKSVSLPVGMRRGTSRPSRRCSKECSLHHLRLQPCCPLLVPRCFLPPYDRYRGRCSAAVVALLPVLPEVLVSQVPRPQSQMVPPPEDSRAAAPAEAAHSLALVVQWADV